MEPCFHLTNVILLMWRLLIDASWLVPAQAEDRCHRDRPYHWVFERKLLPTFSIVRTDRHLYGFRGANGLWLTETLGLREKVNLLHSNDYGAVLVTNERVLGFTPLIGGFSSKPLDVHESIVEVENKDGLILVSTTRRTLSLAAA